MQKLRAFSKSKDSDSDYEKPKRSFTAPGSPKSLDVPTSPSSSLNAVTAESSGKLSPELAPIVSLLSAQSHRKYQEGVFMLLKDLDSDGSPSDRKWLEVYGIMIGNELAYWDSDQLESSGSIVLGDNKPSYINFSDGTFKPCLKLPSANGSIENVIVLSTTLKNRFLLQFPTKEEFHGWSCAFRLASFEFKSLQEAYTASLLSSRGALLSDIRVILSEKKFNYEDWVSVRFGAGMPWKRCFAVIEPSKKSRKGFKHGFIYFYENEKMSKKLLMAKITSISSVYALYPRNYTIIDKSTLIKLDGAIQFDQKESSKSCSIFLMPEQHTSVPGYDTLIRFLIPLMDSFNLYGRPTRLNADKTDIDSLLFGLPVLPKVHYLEVDDLLPMADNLGSIDWDQNEWNANIKKFLKSKLDRGYTGCGSEDGVNGAVDMLNSSKDMADGKIRFFINKPEANRYLENSPHARSIHQMSSSEENTINPSVSASASRLELADSHSNNSTGNVKSRSAQHHHHHHHHHHNPHPLQGQPQQAQQHHQYQQPSNQNVNPTIQLSNDSLGSPERSEHNSTPQNATAFANNSPSPQVVNIYTKYSEIPDSEKLNYGKHAAADLSHTLQKVKLEDDDDDIFKERRAPKKKTATVDDLYPSGDINDEGDDEEYEEQYSGRQYRPDSDGDDDDDDDDDEDDDDEDDPGFAFISPKTEGDRVFSPFTNFNNDFRKAIQMDENQRDNNNSNSSIDKVKNKGENLNLHLNLPKQRSPMKNVINSHDNNSQPLGTDRKVEGVNRYFSNPTDSKPFSQERRAPSGNIVPQQPPFDAHGVHPPVNPYSSTQPHTPVAQVLGSPATPAAPKQARDLSPFGKPSKPSNYETNGPDSPLGPDYSRQPPAPPQHQNIKYTNSPELIPPHQYKSNGPIAPNLKSNMNGNPQQSSRNAANPLNSPGTPSFGAYGPMKLPSPVVNGNTNAQHFPRNQQSNSSRRPAPPQGQGNGPPFPQQMGYPLGKGPSAGPGSNPNPNGYDYSARPDYNQYPPNQNQNQPQPHHQPPQPYQQQYQQQYHQQYQQPPPPPPQQQRPPPNQYGAPHYGNQPMAPPQGYGPPPGGNPMMYPPNGTQSGMKMGRRPPPNQQQQQQQPAPGRSFKHDPYALTKK